MTAEERAAAALFWLNAARRYAAAGCVEGMREAAWQAGRIARETEEGQAREAVWRAVREDMGNRIHGEVSMALAADILPWQLNWLGEEEWYHAIHGRDGREDPVAGEDADPSADEAGRHVARTYRWARRNTPVGTRR
jgi:hypothetical protein